MFGMCQLGSAVDWPVGVYACWILHAYLYGFYTFQEFQFHSGQTKGLSVL
jgi:hypothetical protein